MKNQLEYLRLADACLQIARNSSNTENKKLLLDTANEFLKQAKKASESEKIGRHPDTKTNPVEPLNP